jgi:hypothetical protein
MPNKSRGQHYAFAHRVLPSLIWTHSEHLWSLLTGSERDAFLQAVWKAAGENQEPSEQVDGTTLRSSIHRHGSSTIFLITLPQPIAPAEAYFVAIIFGNPPPITPAESSIDQIRYFTLELAHNVITQEQYTVVAEWRKAQHFNLGSGPRPDTQAFLEHLGALL